MGLSTAEDRLSLRGFVAPLKRSNTRKKRNPKDQDYCTTVWRSEDVLSSAPFRFNVEIKFLASISLHG